ncbi:MAG: hypothetical protein CMJ05_09820 [Pelagibacterales bacterium]|nr:hypothetical protein [Pelagibacterales bacterium]
MRFLISIALVLYPFLLFSQIHYRVSADFSIKESDGHFDNLNMGKIYYDLVEDILVYNMYFPEKLDWVIHDTSFYTFRNNEIENRFSIPKINSENILHLSLTGDLNDFGISKTNLYDLSESKYEDSLIISTYKPTRNKIEKFFGKIVISLKKGKLNGIIFFNTNDEIVKKLIIQKYEITNGLFIPNKILEIIYLNNKETYKITSFKNIKLNEQKNENYYNYLNFNN